MGLPRTAATRRPAGRGSAAGDFGRRPHLTIRLRHGIRFADDPAFGGKARELTAADVVYSWKRISDPRTRSPSVSLPFVGADAAVAAAKEKGRLDYDTDRGLRASIAHAAPHVDGTDYALLPQLTLSNLAGGT
jgi:hypothetical protein